MFDLTDKVAIVTGSRRGIGRGIAERLAYAGAKVVVSDLEDYESTAKEIAEQMHSETLGVRCDVSKKEDVENLISKVIERFGKLDILVNNAGIFPFVPFEKMTEPDWDKVIDINLKSVFLCSSAAAKVMKPGSKIVSISSIAAFIGFSGLTHYCASKGGINSLTRAMSLELAPKKININAVAPGAIETPGAASTDTVKEQTVAAIPWKRMGQPSDIANAVHYLVSDEADYVTGHTLVVDGGWTIQ